MLGIPLALAVANAAEWLIHKHILHGQGKRRESMWSFHWHEHHKNARRNGNFDDTYERPLLGWHSQAKEALGLVGLAAVHLPLLPIAPFYTVTMWTRIANYHRVHKRAHLDPAWAREHLPWHYDHHMGPDQDANWCVTHPWFDEIMGTRVPYAGTERERADIAKREALAAKKAERGDRVRQAIVTAQAAGAESGAA